MKIKTNISKVKPIIIYTAFQRNEVNLMSNYRGSKHKKIVAAIIAVLLIASMVISVFISALA